MSRCNLQPGLNSASHAGQRAAQYVGTIAVTAQTGEAAAGPFGFGAGSDGGGFGLLPVLFGDDTGFAQHPIAFQRLGGNLGIGPGLARIGQRLAVIGRRQRSQRLPGLDRSAHIDRDALHAAGHLRENAHRFFLVPDQAARQAQPAALVLFHRRQFQEGGLVRLGEQGPVAIDRDGRRFLRLGFGGASGQGEQEGN